MSAAVLLLDLGRLGIRLEADGERLRYFPQSALTPDLLDRLKAHKAELLAMLRPAPRVPCVVDPFDAPRPRKPVRRCVGAPLPPECRQHGEPVRRPTIQGQRLFCSVCSRRIGVDQPYPW